MRVSAPFPTRWLLAAGVVPLLLAACGEPTTAVRAGDGRVALAPSAPAAALSSVVSDPDVQYGMLHGSFRLYNSTIVGVGTGSYSGNDAFVQPGSTVSVQGNWQVGPVTDPSYGPGCIIEMYVAWVAPAASNGATPFNQGLWMGQTPFYNPNPSYAGGYGWSPSAPTVEGEYFIGAGGTLDYSFQWWAQGGLGGLTSNTSVVGASYRVVVDGTAPDIAFTGGGAYELDDMVAVSCTATDTLAGVASASCPTVSGAAWTFGLGAHTVTASATDRAGNAGSASATFTVGASTDGVCALVTQWSSNAGVANSLCAKLRAAAAAGPGKTANNILGAALNELSAQSGKKIPADKAALLASYVQAMMT
jgi:hypothetical protein